MQENTTPNAARASVPAFKSYAVANGACSLRHLPFVDYPGGSIRDAGATHWQPAPVAGDDADERYVAAMCQGQANGIHLAQYLKDNPMWVNSGITAKILADMGKPDSAEARGYMVGFCGYLETLIHAATAHEDLASHLAQTQQQHDAAVNTPVEEV